VFNIILRHCVLQTSIQQEAWPACTWRSRPAQDLQFQILALLLHNIRQTPAAAAAAAAAAAVLRIHATSPAGKYGWYTVWNMTASSFHAPKRLELILFNVPRNKGVLWTSCWPAGTTFTVSKTFDWARYGSGMFVYACWLLHAGERLSETVCTKQLSGSTEVPPEEVVRVAGSNQHAEIHSVSCNMLLTPFEQRMC
jgi:hypothetical protein